MYLKSNYIKLVIFSQGSDYLLNPDFIDTDEERVGWYSLDTKFRLGLGSGSYFEISFLKNPSLKGSGSFFKP